MTGNPYENAAAVLIAESGCEVSRWRKTMSGTAYTKDENWRIEAPYPRGPISFGIFAHEVGHQMLHRIDRRYRWLEELEAWEFSLSQFDRFVLPGKAAAMRRAAGSLRYAAWKTSRRASDATMEKLELRYPAWVWKL